MGNNNNYINEIFNHLYNKQKLIQSIREIVKIEEKINEQKSNGNELVNQDRLIKLYNFYFKKISLYSIDDFKELLKDKRIDFRVLRYVQNKLSELEKTNMSLDTEKIK